MLTKKIFYIDNLAIIMMSLISFIGIVVISFSIRYLQGDRKQARFFLNMIISILTILVMVSTDHIFLLLIAWSLGNLFFTRLMLHKNEWAAARASSNLAFKNFILVFLFSSLAFCSLYYISDETSIQAILNYVQSNNRAFNSDVVSSNDVFQNWLTFSAFFLFLSAMSQSALWPFHRWLISSMNSPTPVSAMMYAGFINGGGFILARFAPIFLEQPFILNLIFIIGIISALLGTLWKLMQHDVKRMLACSTIGQMGFMIAQCGLGLFAAAITHLCWYGLFKAYLFLSSGSAAQIKYINLKYPPKIKHFMLALLCGIGGTGAFALINNYSIMVFDTRLFLIGITLVGCTQFSLHLIKYTPLVATVLMGSIYGLNVSVIVSALKDLNIEQPQALNILHIYAFIILTIAWLSIMFLRHKNLKRPRDWMLKLYVAMLNASQPHSKTITTCRNQYQY